MSGGYEVRQVSVFFLLLLLSGIPIFSFSQRIDTIDSLERVGKQVSGIDQLNTYYELTFQYLDAGNFEKSLSAITEAHAISRYLGDTLKIIKTGRVKGQILRRLDRPQSAISVYLDILDLSESKYNDGEDFFLEYADILNGMAIAYTFQANYDKALQYNFKSLVLRESRGDSYEISVALNNIGLVYFKLQNFDKANGYYLNALEYLTKSGNSTFKDRLLINIGICYIQNDNDKDKFNKAIDYISKGLSLCKLSCDSVTVMEGNFGLGRSYYALRKFPTAKNHFTQSLLIARALNDKRVQVESLVQLAELENDTNNETKAKIYLQEAEGLVQGTGYTELILSIYKCYFIIYNKSNEYKDASYYQNRYINLKDSVYSEDLIKNLASVQAKYDERANLETIEKNNLSIRLQNEEIARQQLWFYAILIITILIILLTLVLIWANRRQRQQNTALSEANQTIENQNVKLSRSNEELDLRVKEKTLDLSKANESLVQVNEELDNFIYRTSHDIRGPLVTMKGVCNIALFDVKDSAALNYLKQLDITAEKLNYILNRLLVVSGIRHTEVEPVTIDFNGILDEVIEAQTKRGLPAGFGITYRLDPQVNLISDSHLVKVILENLLENSIKFYKIPKNENPYANVDIRLTDEERISIRVIDNGVGVNPGSVDKLFRLLARVSERSKIGGVGLYMCRLAAQRLGGSVSLVSSTGEKTIFEVILPGDLRLLVRDEKVMQAGVVN